MKDFIWNSLKILSESPKKTAKSPKKSEKKVVKKFSKKETATEYRLEPNDLLKPMKPYGENIKEILTFCNKTNILVEQISKAKVFNFMEFK